MELGLKSFRSMSVNCDSTGALHGAGNWTCSSRTKHITSGFFFGGELAKTDKITTHHVSTRQLLADCANKHLTKNQFG